MRMRPNMNAFVALIIGLLLIFLELYLPGAILGILGGIFVVISLVLFALQNNSPFLVVLFVIAAVVLVGLTIKLALWRIRTAKARYSIYSDDAQTGYFASTFDKSAIGKIGTVLTDLKPGGYIIVDGKQHQALSKSGYIVKGHEVKIIGGQEESLLVVPKIN
jgi:membrane-bound ClpP family serine protease